MYIYIYIYIYIYTHISIYIYLYISFYIYTHLRVSRPELERRFQIARRCRQLICLNPRGRAPAVQLEPHLRCKIGLQANPI